MNLVRAQSILAVGVAAAVVVSGCFLVGGEDMTCSEYGELGTSTSPDDEQVDLILDRIDEDDLVLPETDVRMAHQDLRSWCNARDDDGEFERADDDVSEFLDEWTPR